MGLFVLRSRDCSMYIGKRLLWSSMCQDVHFQLLCVSYYRFVVPVVVSETYSSGLSVNDFLSLA